MIESHNIVRYSGGFGNNTGISPAIFTNIGWVTLDSIAVATDAPRSVLSQEFDSWLKREAWQAIDHLARISVSPADIWMCIEYMLRRNYAPWRPYAIAYAISEIDLSHGIEPRRLPFDAFDRADVVLLDDDNNDRMVVGVWTSTSMVVFNPKNERNNERTPFFSLLPAIQTTPGVDSLRICLDHRLSNVINYDSSGDIECTGSQVVEQIKWFAMDAKRHNDMWITRRLNRVSLATGNGKRLDVMLDGSRPLFAPNLAVSEILAPEAMLTPDSVNGSMLYIPEGADVMTAMHEAVRRWVRHAASLANWRHDIEESVNVAEDIREMLTTEIERRVSTLLQEK